MIFFVDFETRSDSPLKAVGAWNYVADPSTEVLSVAIVREDGLAAWVWSPFGTKFGYLGDPPGLEECVLYENALPTFGPGDQLCAHNAESFDRPVWEALGWPAPSGGWLDSQPRARRASLPGKLESLCAFVLGVGKDKEARKVTLEMSKRRKLSKAAVDACVRWVESGTGPKPPALRWLLGPEPWDPALLRSLATHPPYGVEVLRDPDEAQLTAIVRYNLLDSALLRMAWIREGLGVPNPDDPTLEVDQKINRRGVKVDLELVQRLLRAADEVSRAAGERAALATQGAVTEETLRSTVELKKWLLSQKIDLPDVKAETVRAAMVGREGPVWVVLQARLEVAKVSAGKLRALKLQTGSDGRLRHAYGYHHAHTGRWNSRGVQIHNLPRAVKGTPVLP